MTSFETPRLLIRPWTEDDAAGMHAIFSDAEAMRFWTTPLSRDAVHMAEVIRYSREAPPEVHAGWAVVRRDDGAIIGFVNYHHRDMRSRRLEIGYIIGRQYWRQSFGAEAVSAFAEHCFGVLDVHRIEATIDPLNLASQRLAERVGFRREGEPMRERLLMPDGRFADVQMYAFLKTDRGRYDDRRFYHAGMLELQDRFDGRRVAEALSKHRRRYDFWPEDRALIEQSAYFFIATSYDGFVDCSLRSGRPGFVSIVGPGVLEFPEYDGNSMYRTLGNISRNPKVGLLFVRFDGKTSRVRINGVATILDDAETLGRHHAAKLVVRVECELFSNCPRSVHDLADGRLSAYLPAPGYEPPPPEWKSRDYIKGILPAGDPHR